MSAAKVALVTGASSGFGLLAAKALAEKGYRVFAAMRETTGKNASVARTLETWGRERGVSLAPVELDVTSDASARAAVATAISAGGRLDVVVNNAGVMAAGLDEAFTDDQFRAVLETNVLGAQRMFRAALPPMRAQRSGLFVTVSSNMAQITLPFAGLYTASKRAVEGLAESYRYELAPLGIDSVIVQPGGYPTSLFAKIIHPADVERTAGYGPIAEMPQKVFGGFAENLKGANAPDPQEVADAIVQLAEAPLGTRPLRTSVDRFTKEGVEAINAASSQVQRGVFQHFGMADLLGPSGGSR